MFRLILIVLFLFSGPVVAQQETGVITMRGTGHVAVKPDMATFTVGVEVQAPTADRALRLNSVRMKEVFALLEDRGIAARDIQTSQFSVHPQWNNQTSLNRPLEITGFVATNTVQVRIRDLALLGSVLDSLTKSGANRIQGVRFTVANPAPHLDEARKKALTEASRKAKLFADAAGVSLGVVLSIQEGGATPSPVYRMEAAMSGGAPIAEGEQTLSADVTIRYAIK